MYQYLASLMKIHDGDTQTFTVDHGFEIYSVHPVRLAGVNAPELSTDAGKASLAWVTQWFSDHKGPYVLDTKKGDETEKFGRYLGRIEAVDGHVLNDDLVAAGQAVVYNP